MARRRLSSLLWVLVLCGGCATAPPRRPVADDARRALALLDARRQEFTDLRTLADIVLTRDRETLREAIPHLERAAEVNPSAGAVLRRARAALTDPM